MKLENDDKTKSSLSQDSSPEEKIIPLLEERLLVNRERHKVGEIVVRKVIKTRTIEVPVQREVLIVEQVGAETKHLAEIDLAEEELNQSVKNKDEKNNTNPEYYSISGEFVSLESAREVLDALAQNSNGDIRVKLEFIAPDANAQKQLKYQEIYNQATNHS